VLLVQFLSASQITLYVVTVIQIILNSSFDLRTGEKVEITLYLRHAPLLFEVVGDLLNGYAGVQDGRQTRRVTSATNDEGVLREQIACGCAVSRRSASEAARRIANEETATLSRLMDTRPRRRNSSQAALTYSALRLVDDAHALTLVPSFDLLPISNSTKAVRSREIIAVGSELNASPAVKASLRPSRRASRVDQKHGITDLKAPAWRFGV